LEKNYSIRMVRNEEQISKNNATLGNAGYLPTLDLSAKYSGNIDDTESTTRSTGEKTKTTGVFDQTINAGLNLNWTLFDGFKIQATYARLKELEKQGETLTRMAIEDFIAELTAEYYNYIQQQIRLKNFRYAMSLSKERLRIVEERLIVGSFSRLDLQQARVDYNADRAQYMKQQESVESSRIRLNELMANQDMSQAITVNDSIIDLNTLMSYDELWESTLQNNASLLKTEQGKKLASLEMKAVKSRNYPYLKLNAGYGYTMNKYEISSTSRRNNLGMNFGVTMGFNLFDENRKREIKNARIAIENAQLQQEDMQQALRADLSNLWQAYQNNICMLKLERENLIVAVENHEIASERYMLGNLSGIEMREAQKSLLDAEERTLAAEYDTKMCEISLLQLSGKITKYLE
jgi:outer membrane protein TolC